MHNTTVPEGREHYIGSNQKTKNSTCKETLIEYFIGLTEPFAGHCRGKALQIRPTESILEHEELQYSKHSYGDQNVCKEGPFDFLGQQHFRYRNGAPCNSPIIS